jgi:hypothetical protein
LLKLVFNLCNAVSLKALSVCNIELGFAPLEKNVEPNSSKLTPQFNALAH